MNQRRKSQSIGLLMIVILSAVLLGALAAVVWPVPVVYAGDPPEILTITVTSSLETYFHDPGLDPTGGTVYFNNVGDEGAGQVITVTTIVTGSMPMTLTGATAFGMTPISDTTDTGELGITYTIGISASTENGVPFTVTDSSGLTDTAVITFTQDNLDPTVEFTDFTDPDYVDANGSNWYDPDNLSAGWYFVSTVTDTLSGLALANASWDHSNDDHDQLTYDPSLDGDGIFNNVDDDGDGVVTVTLTITDNVGNSSNDLVVLNLDDTDPTIISPTLDAPSNFSHADGPTLYYGDDMVEAVVFSVEGAAQDDGAGPYQTTYSDAFESPPTDDDLAPPSYSWEGYYVVAPEEDYGSGTITVTVSDQVGNSATQVFDYVRDTISPTVVPITITESSPSLHAEGLTLYYSDMMDGSAQDFEVQGTASDEGGAGFKWVTFAIAFGDSLDPDSNSPWSGVYNVVSSNNGDGNIVVTAYDNVSNWSTGVFTYIEDTTTPTLTLTTVTSPGYDENTEPLDTDGSNWYNAGDFTAGGGSGWEFTSDTADEGAGLDSGSAFWDHSANQTDRSLDCGPGGDGTFSTVSGDAEGTVAVTVVITDNVSNSASDTVAFNIDNTKPTITSPYISEGSDYLYVDDLTIYYGNDMGWPQSFYVNGHSSDDGGVGLNVTDTVDFSTALWDTPSNSGTREDWSGAYNADSGDTTSGQIIVTVYDLLNNPATQVFTYTRDTGDPSSGASSPQYDNGNPIVVTYTNATDTGSVNSGLQEVELWYKKEVTGAWANSGLPAQTGSSGTFNFIPTGDGTYYFASVATDNVGNQETTPTGSGDDDTLYDTKAPSVPEPVNFAYQDDSDSGGDGIDPLPGYYDDMVIDLDWNPFTEDGSGLLTYHLGTAPHPTSGSYAEDSSYTVGSSGTYSIYLTAEDNAGNISDDAVTELVVVDDQAPQGSVDCPEGTAEKSFTVSWSATNDQGPAGLHPNDPYSVGYNVDGGGWQDWITATSAVTATFGPDSPVTVDYDHTYCFRVRAVDKAGNVSEWVEDCTEVSGAYGPGTKSVFLPIIMAPDSNWGFETGNFTNWQHGGELAQSVSTAMPHSGSYSALLGSPSYACNSVPVGSAWLRRSVTVPSSGSPTLSFWYRIYTQDKNSTLSEQYDFFAVYINDSQLVVKDANISDNYGCDKPINILPWKQVIFDLDAYRGQTIQLTFYNYNRAPNGAQWYNTYTYVDDVSVQ